MSLHPILQEKLEVGLLPAPTTGVTPRNAYLPALAQKVHAVIGMRRVGKTAFLRQLQDERQRATAPERAVYVSFDDDRLADLPLAQLNLQQRQQEAERQQQYENQAKHRTIEQEHSEAEERQRQEQRGSIRYRSIGVRLASFWRS